MLELEAHVYIWTADMIKKIALSLLIISGGLMLIERATMLVSDGLAKGYCGESYLQLVDGVMGSASCGFGWDIYLTIVLFSTMFIGMFLFLFGHGLGHNLDEDPGRKPGPDLDKDSNKKVD